MSPDRTRLKALGRRLRPAPEAETHEGLSPREQLVMGSGLFDAEWYAEQTGLPSSPRLALVRHYLEFGYDQDISPHPLIHPRTLAEGLGDRWREGRDPLATYLRLRAWRVAPHPLVDARAYLADHPDAAEHPDGPIGHHEELGTRRWPTAWQPPKNDAGDPEHDLGTWVRHRWREWRARARDLPTGPVDELPSGWGPPSPATAVTERITVVVDAGHDTPALESSLRSVAAQLVDDLQVVVLGRAEVEGADLDEVVRSVLPSADVVVLEAGPAGLDAALAAADGAWVGFLAAGDTWLPGRLAALLAAGHDLVVDALETVDAEAATRWSLPSAGAVRTREAPELAQVLVRRTLLPTLPSPLSGLLGAWEFDLVVRLASATEVHVVHQVGLRRDDDVRREALAGPVADRPFVEHERLPSWRDVVLGRRLIDWDDLAARRGTPDLVSVVIPTYDDWRMTTAAVNSVIASVGTARSRDDGVEVECLVWDNGSSATTSVALDALAVRHPRVRVFHSAVNHGFALGNNLLLSHARGETVVFLNNDTTVPVGWLSTLVARLQDPAVLGAQPLLVYPSGAVQSAGVAFAPAGALPHVLLRGYPVEDAAGLADAPLAAVTGAALALRRDDAVALRGFDPVFTNGMEDVDLCRRLSDLREGSFRVLPEVRVVHHESRTPGRYVHHLDNRKVWLDRWRSDPVPSDDVDLWGRCGYTVVDRVPVQLRDPVDRRLLAIDPVVVRTQRLERGQVHEHPPRLRWAVKCASPGGPSGALWGDTYFAESLADGLRACGQEVVVDRRPEHDRTSGSHDDVVLTLRGLTAYVPAPGQVSLLWVISHPDLVTRSELGSYDAVLAAGPAWAADVQRTWGLPVEPLLQATDPRLFAPGATAPDGEPVLFVGNSRRHYRQIVRDAVEAGVPIGVHGALWDAFLPPGVWRGRGIANEKLARAYRSAGVVLNDHWDDMRSGGFVSNRLFDAVASGARVVSDDIAGLEDLFGASVQVYRTPADLARLCTLPDPDAVFGSAEDRAAVAERVRREHSFEVRARRLVEVAVAAGAAAATGSGTRSRRG